MFVGDVRNRVRVVLSAGSKAVQGIKDDEADNLRYVDPLIGARVLRSDNEIVAKQSRVAYTEPRRLVSLKADEAGC